jgi:prophage maintenance system killer protein
LPIDAAATSGLVFWLAASFLEFNRKSLAAPADEAIAAVMALAAGKLDELGFAAWLRKHIS